MVPPTQSTSPPHLKSDFQRDGAPASWKDSYPRQWGSEVYRLPFGSTRINSASLSSDERLLAVAVERDIHIFDTETFKVAEKLEGHTQEVGHVEFQRRPTPQSSEGYNDPSSGRRRLRVHYLSIPDDSWTRSEPAVAHLSTVFSAALEDASRMHHSSHQTSIPNAVIPGFGSSAFSPDGTTLLFTSTVNEGRVGPRARVTAYDLATEKEKFHMEGHMDSIMWTGFSPNGKMIASSAWDSMLKVYSATDGTLLRDYGKTGGQNWAAAFSPDSKFIAVGSGSGSVFLWEVDDPQAFPFKIDGFPGWIRSLSWSPDSQLLAAGSMGGKLVVFNPYTRSNEQVWEIDMEESGLGYVEIGDVKFLAPRKDEHAAGQGNALAFDTGSAGLLVYDFSSNTKCYWGPREQDPWSPGYWDDTIMTIAKKKWIGNIDQDGAMRFWDLPY